MAIHAKIARGYAWRMIIIGAVCAVLGAWGVYDYAVDIPRRQRLGDRLALLQSCQAALETEQSREQVSPEARAAAEAVEAEMGRVIGTTMEEIGGPDALVSRLEEAKRGGGQLVLETSQANVDWLDRLQVIREGLVTPRKLPLTEQSYPVAFAAYEATQAAMDDIGEVKAPGKHDRLIQWVYILCLPCAPYFFWLFYTANRQVYRLDEDGTLHAPEGTWTSGEIADIDMSRWMAKSVAYAVHRDGSRLKLDDFKYRNLHLIIGAIASRLRPDEWDAEAKPIAARQEAADAEAAADAGVGDAAAQPVTAPSDA